MKKMLILLAILSLTVTTINAQFVRGYGLKVGSTLSNQDWDYDNSSGFNFNPDNRIGLNVGLFAELLDIPFFSVVTEFNYIQKGMTDELNITTADNPSGISKVEWDSRLDYINISVLGKFRLNYLLFRPYLLLGPKIDFEIVKESNLSGGLEDDFESNRIGLKAGIGTEINLLPVTIMAELLYDADLNELYENENLKVNTSSFDFRLGIMF